MVDTMVIPSWAALIEEQTIGQLLVGGPNPSPPAVPTVNKRVQKLPELQVAGIGPKRRVGQPTFRQLYLSSDDVWLRLGNTMIYIGPEMFMVEEVYTDRDQDYIFVLSDADDTKHRVSYNNTPLLDLRSPEPRFVQMGGAAWYFVRVPTRQQKQGVHNSNSFLIKAGNSSRSRLYNNRGFMRGMRQQDDIQWTNEREALLRDGVCETLRLSNLLAVYSTDQTKIHSFYKGRYLGPVSGDEIIVDTDDFGQPWLRRDVELVGMKLKETSDALRPEYFNS